MNTTHSTSAATDILSNELITCSATIDAQEKETTTTSVASNATSSVNALSSPSLFEHATTTAVENATSPNLPADTSVDMDVTDTEMDNVCIDEDMEVDVLCGDVTFSNVTEDGVVDPPTVGMLFESREAAKLYYLKYAHQQGFSIRIRNIQKRGRGCQDFNETDFVCVREGKRVLPDVIEPTQKKKKNTSTCKCDCKARMRVVLKDEEKKWRVMNFCDEHVHCLVSPDKKVLMKTMKVFPKVACVLSEKFREVNLLVSNVPSVCGAENLGFNKRDCYNHLNSKMKMYKTPEESDATAGYDYFKKKSIEDPIFFYAVQTDSDSRVVNFFWIDGRSREQYQHFGDIVLFDTTYRSNAYSMPFGSFTGLNHHRECIQFGCALFLDETEESSVWLFETWLSAMGGRSPVALLTDQDKEMTNAVRRVFPNTRHRFCLWHVTAKFPDHLAHAYAKRKEFAGEMNKCLHGTYSTSEFEMKWEEMLQKNNLSENVWPKKLYDIRETWVPVYFLDTFFAGQNTIGCSESINRAYKDYFFPDCNLRNFITQNEWCLKDLAIKERDEDFQSEHKTPIVAESDYLLKDAGRVYTRHVYLKFKEQYEKALHYRIEKKESGRFFFMKSKKKNAARIWRVEFDENTYHGSCECKMF